MNELDDPGKAGLKVGLVGTSWWADAMYLPALADHSEGRITAICGRNTAAANALADRYGIAETFSDWRDILEVVDAVIIASPNDSHEEIALAAIEQGKHVLCEKPLALDAAGAWRMAEAATAKGVTTMTPFTYRFMPAFQWVKALIDDGYVGTPYHLNLRYQTGYARGGEYAWRFDEALSGGGVIGDIGSHFLHVARWWLGDITGVSALAGRQVARQPRPDGSSYRPAEDSSLMTLRFASGAHGSIQATALAWEGDGIGQTHNAEIHGSAGTLHVRCDWDAVQEVQGIRSGESGRARLLPIPEPIWAGVRRDTVHHTQSDVFRTTDTMARLWLSCAARQQTCQPDLTEGARVQDLVEAALKSAASNCVMVDVSI
jgi:predicted dehydrogenase